MSSDPQTLKNVADVWLATALARSVFPEGDNNVTNDSLCATPTLRDQSEHGYNHHWKLC